MPKTPSKGWAPAGTKKRIGSTKSPSKNRTKKTPAKKSDALGPMFGGCLESEIRTRTLPDLIRPNLLLLFVGINPGLYSAHRGHYYSKKGNHFWPCLAQSGLVPAHFGPDNDVECLEHGVGMTDIVGRCTRAQSELSSEEFGEGARKLREKLVKFNPMLVVFNGKQIFARFVGKRLKDVTCGVQSYCLDGCVSMFYVMTNSSPLNAHYPTALSRMFYYQEIRALLDELKRSPYFKSQNGIDEKQNVSCELNV